METGSSRFGFIGILNVTTASKALDIGKRLFAQQGNVDLDLGGVTAADTAGLALLLERIAWGISECVSIKYRNIPQRSLSLAQ